MASTHPAAILPTIALLVSGAMSGSGCSDSRLDPAGLRPARTTALESLPPSARAKARVGPRPTALWPRPVTGATITTPPYRLDVRVDPADLALLPLGAALVAAIRPDLPMGLAGLLGPHWQALQRLPALQWLGRELLTKSLATPLGLRPDRAILVAFLANVGDVRPLKEHLDAQARLVDRPAASAQIRAALKPGRVPATTVRIRVVARVADIDKARAGVRTLVTRARQAGHKTLHLLGASTAPAPLDGLASRGVVAVGHGADSAQAWTLSGGRLLVDFLLPVSGPWSATRAAKELGVLLADRPQTAAPSSPFDRGVLLSSADLSLAIHGPGLAQAARWLGVRDLLAALAAADPKQRPRLFRLGWRIANVPVNLQTAGKRLFDGCGVRVYLLGARPQLRISWHLTGVGHKLLDGPTAAVTGRDLAQDNGLVERWLKPLAARVPQALPPEGPLARAGLHFEGGIFMWPLALAELWPWLLPLKPVRKAVLKILRTQIRPGRFVRRINVRRHGSLLELVLEGKPPRLVKGRLTK
jgi:hypothetical protein